MSRFSGVVKDIEPTPSEDHVTWNKEHINRNASNVREALFGFDHIIEVNWRKIFEADFKHDKEDPPWKVRKAFNEVYTYPFRELGENSVILEMRGIYNERDIFVRNEFGGDGVFIGTNNEADAIMIALKYS